MELAAIANLAEVTHRNLGVVRHVDRRSEIELDSAFLIRRQHVDRSRTARR